MHIPGVFILLFPRSSWWIPTDNISLSEVQHREAVAHLPRQGSCEAGAWWSHRTRLAGQVEDLEVLDWQIHHHHHNNNNTTTNLNKHHHQNATKILLLHDGAGYWEIVRFAT